MDDRRSHRRDGADIADFLHRIIALPARVMRRLRYHRAQQAIDRQYGTESLVPLAPDDFTTSHPARAFAYANFPSPVPLFEEALRHVPIEAARLTFIDLGAGKGLVLMLAAARGFARVIGVELEPTLCAQGRRNLDLYRRKEPAAPPITLVEGDAAGFAFPPEPLLVYLYNPFGPELLTRVLAGLRESLAVAPRPCWIVYLRPLHHALMMENGFLTLKAKAADRAGDSYAVYAAAP